MRGTLVPSLVKIRLRVTSQQIGEIGEMSLSCDFFIYLFFFSRNNVEKTPGRILTRNGSKDAIK